LKIEINEYIEKNREKTDENGRRLVFRNGYNSEREIHTGIGPIMIKQPRKNSVAGYCPNTSGEHQA